MQHNKETNDGECDAGAGIEACDVNSPYIAMSNRIARGEYDTDLACIVDTQFMADLLAAYRLTDHESANRLYTLACEHGEGPAEDVLLAFDDFPKLLLPTESV